MIELAIYTVLTGDKEPLGNPTAHLESTETDLRLSFICFTDNPGLKSNIWRCQELNTNALPPEKSSRRPKALPHVYLPNYQYSLYIDNICELKRLPNSNDLNVCNKSNYLYRLFKHNTRTSIVEECLAIAALGYDTSENLIRQLESYKKVIQLNAVTPLSTCTVLLREHSNSNVIQHGIMWWEHILNYSKRDQMSFDFCRLATGLKIDYFEGSKFENNLIHAHSNVTSNRRLANIDDTYYKKVLERNDVSNDHTAPSLEEAEYASSLSIIRSSLLEMLLYFADSGLGAYHYPRLNLSKELEKILDGYRGKIDRLYHFFDNAQANRSLMAIATSKSSLAIGAYLNANKVYSMTGSVNNLFTLTTQTHLDSKSLVLIFSNKPQSTCENSDLTTLIGSTNVAFLPIPKIDNAFYGQLELSDL